jgi:hypothetical protein
LMTHTSQVASAIDRVLEVALGGVTGFVISYLLFPSNAHAVDQCPLCANCERGQHRPTYRIPN